MKHAQCPICQVVHEVVDPDVLLDADSDLTYSLTHCSLCESPTALFRVLPDDRHTAKTPGAYPSAVVLDSTRSYASLWLAPLPQLQSWMRQGLAPRTVLELADDMHLSHHDVAKWVGISVLDAISRIRLGEMLDNEQSWRLLYLLRLVGQVEVLTGSQLNGQPFKAAPWVANWLTSPNTALGGRRPEQFLVLPSWQEIRLPQLIAEQCQGVSA